MLVIRNGQMQRMEAGALQSFEDELVQQMTTFAPRHSAVIGAGGVRQVVQLGMERAAAYGLTNRGPSRFYVEMMFMFGSDFDTDLQLPWARGVLTNEAITDQMRRADTLHDELLAYLDQVYGADDRYLFEAMRRLKTIGREDHPITEENFDRYIIATLSRVFPQKCAYLGDRLLRALIQRGTELAAAHAVTSKRGAALFVALMFAIGQGFANDPLFPWISATLHDANFAPNQRAERLQAKVMVYLEKAVQNLGQTRNNVQD
jgi:hypothetical protein